ncbi:MAG: AAA family ATPase [Culicoidibacterales bacterium]
MKFKKIILENFRQFSGKNEINFSLDPEKNITVIHAMNGSGKTTLLESFRWALYGGQINLDKPNELLNRDLALVDGIYTVGITLEFVQNEVEYCLKRYYRSLRVYNKNYALTNRPRLELMFVEEGQTKHLENEEAQNLINGFFSSQVADYFFYDGERIKKLGENLKSASNDISRGMDSIMNVFYVKNVVNRLQKDILSSYNSQYDQEAQNKLKKLDEEIHKIDNEITLINRKYIQSENEIEQNQFKIEEIDSDILRYKNVEESQNEIMRLEKVLRTAEVKLKNILSGVEVKKLQDNKVNTKIMNASIPEATTEYIKTSLQEMLLYKVEKKLHNISLVSDDIQGLSFELLTRMEKLGDCVCGQKVNLAEIEQLKAKMETVRDIEQLKRAVNDFGYFTNLKLVESRSEKAYEVFEEVREEYLRLAQETQFIDLKIKNLKANQNQMYDFKAKYDEKDALQKRNNQLNQLIGRLNMDLTRKTTQKEQKLVEQDKIRQSAQLNEQTALHIQTVKDLIKLGENSIKQKTQKAEAVLIEKTKLFFEEMAHKGTKYIQVETKPHYRYDVYNKLDGKKSSLSEGERNIASLAYIAGIISAAKTHYRGAGETNNLVEDGAEIPLILDAPFAKLDSIHIQNVASIVPKLADQVILFTVDQQFTGSAQATVADQIGQQYDMENESDSVVKLTIKK